VFSIGRDYIILAQKAKQNNSRIAADKQRGFDRNQSSLG
jgi:hypothetical protein